MGKLETGQGRTGIEHVFALVLGGLLALGIELVILLLGSVAASAGIFKLNAAPQLTVAACLVGCVAGGVFACARWRSKRLPAGVLTGLICFILILITALFGGKDLKFGAQAFAELAACVIGGGLAGLLSGRRKRTPKKKR